MSCTQALLSLLLLSPCGDGGGPAMDLPIATALAAPERLESDRLRDPLRKPDEVLQFFGLQPGMSVLDLFSGGGYYTEIASRTVGPQGHVTAHNNKAYLGFVGDEIETRYRDDRLPNVTQVVAEANDLELPPATFDLALAMLTWHDFYVAEPDNGWPAIDEPTLTRKLCAALKPGAVLGVVDHVAPAGSDVRETAGKLHRIDPQRIKADLEGSCFEYEGELSVLRNPADDYTKSVFDPTVRGETDRVVYRFRRRE